MTQTADTDTAGVLDGIRVFDMTLAAVGPWSTKLLAQLGADVIHVESPVLEMSHHIPPNIKGTGVLYISANHNKRNMMLDLKSLKDREQALELVGQCDLFVQNMRPGAVDRLGFDYETVSLRNPAIIYVSASAYGREGPMAAEAGVDPLLQAFCGWSSLNGPVGSRGEMFRHYAHLDINTSSMIVEAVLQALIHRERTGEGQFIELEMLTAALSIQTTRLAETLATGEQPIPMGSATSTTVPHQAFRCEDQRWLAVGVERNDLWPGFCRAMGLDELIDDPRFATNPDRVTNREHLIPVISDRFADRPAAWWVLRLSKESIPNSEIMDFNRLRYHPQVTQNGHLVELDTDHWGHLVVEGPPWRLTKTPEKPVRGAGRPGEHTSDVLRELGIGEGSAETAPQASGAER